VQHYCWISGGDGGSQSLGRGWCGYISTKPNNPGSHLVSFKYQCLVREGGCLHLHSELVILMDTVQVVK
jgi:hypothetical protein